jgi:hypothetical protein
MSESSRKTILFTGRLPVIKTDLLLYIWIYLVRGSEVLAEVEPAQAGDFSFALARDKVLGDGTEGIEVLVGPGSAKEHLARIPSLARLPIERSAIEKAEGSLHVATEKLEVTEEALALWLRWSRRYCVSGVVVAPDGCPVPGADVTVYTVGFDGWGFTKVPRATVATDANGFFTACFCWSLCPYSCSCWPCWPFWWRCWPWWWELDILHVIETLNQIPAGLNRSFAEPHPATALLRPEGRELIRGQGFAGFRSAQTTTTMTAAAQFKPDSARTALIQRRFSDARLREIFPWWWWCCDDPNIVFSATQGGVSIVNEDPATDTRWCLPSGSSVTLIANKDAITACPGALPPPSGFAWTRVGNITVDTIHGGYADGTPGSDASDMAFAGTLNIYGEFAVGAASYYQVNAGQWAGNPLRGGTAPGSSVPISADLSNHVFIFSGATMIFSGPIKMGPFTKNGVANLYATQEARQAGLAPPTLPPFPPHAATDFVIWAYNGLKVSAGSSYLIGGGSVGAVDLTVAGYDADCNPVTLATDAPLTLEIDNTLITTMKFNSFKAFTAKGNPATQTKTGDCPAWDVGPGGYVKIAFTASDINGHISAYEVVADWGHGHEDQVLPGLRNYSQVPLLPPLPPPGYQAPNYSQKSWVGGDEVLTYTPPVDCCYDFRLRAAKRVTNGEDSPPNFIDYDFWTMSLQVSQ